MKKRGFYPKLTDRKEEYVVYLKEGAYPVVIDEDAISALGVGFVKADMIDETDVIRHNPDKLAKSVMRMIYSLRHEDNFE